MVPSLAAGLGGRVGGGDVWGGGGRVKKGWYL